MLAKQSPMICLSDLLPTNKTSALVTFDFRLFDLIEEGSTAKAVELSTLQRTRKSGLQEIFSCAVVTCNAEERVFSEIIEFLRKEGLEGMPYLLVVTNRYTDKKYTSITNDLNKIYSRLYLMLTFDEKGRLFMRHKTMREKEVINDANSETGS